MKNILFFGDSLTAGYGLRDVAAESVPGLIQQKINADGLAYHVINAGLSGDTSAGGLTRLNYWLQRPVDVFVLELGVNDVMRGIPPESIFNNLQAIVTKVKITYPNAKLALMGMQIPDFIKTPVATQFSAIFSRLANVNGMALVPFFLEGVAGKSRLNLRDRIHPNAEGYQVIAENVYPVIKKLLI